MKTNLHSLKSIVILFLLFSLNSILAQDIIYQEDFNDGEAAGWTPILNSVEGNWSVQENTATSGGLQYSNSNGADMISSVYMTEDFENFSLTATIYSVWGNKVGIIFNYQDEDNFYVLEHWGGEKKAYLREKVDGVWETGEGNEADGGYFWNADSLYQNNDKYQDRIALDIASEWYETGEFADNFRIDNADGKTSVWINDVLIFDQIETPLFTSGKIGFFTHWCPAFFDDIKIVPAGSVTGIDEIENNNNKSLVIFPNPVNGGIFTIDTKDFGNRINIEIYNYNGQLLMNESVINSMKYVVNVNERHLNKGIYILRVSSGNIVSSVKLVIN